MKNTIIMWRTLDPSSKKYNGVGHYGRNLWEEFMGGIYGRNLWEEFMGGIYGRNLWEETELFYIA